MNQIEEFRDIYNKEIKDEVRIIINQDYDIGTKSVLGISNENLDNQRIITPNSIGNDNFNSSDESKVTQPSRKIKRKYKTYKIYTTEMKRKIMDEVS